MGSLGTTVQLPRSAAPNPALGEWRCAALGCHAHQTVALDMCGGRRRPRSMNWNATCGARTAHGFRGDRTSAAILSRCLRPRSRRAIRPRRPRSRATLAPYPVDLPPPFAPSSGGGFYLCLCEPQRSTIQATIRRSLPAIANHHDALRISADERRIQNLNRYGARRAIHDTPRDHIGSVALPLGKSAAAAPEMRERLEPWKRRSVELTTSELLPPLRA